MKRLFCFVTSLIFVHGAGSAESVTPAPQKFRQEISQQFADQEGAPTGPIQLIECPGPGTARVFAAGKWHEFRAGHWQVNPELTPSVEGEFFFAETGGKKIKVTVPWRDIRQVLRFDSTNFLATAHQIYRVADGKLIALAWPANRTLNHLAISPNGVLHAAASDGLFRQSGQDWERLVIADGMGRNWAVSNVLGAAFDSHGKLWFATKAGVGRLDTSGWKFYEGKDGLPWNDFTGIWPGPEGDVWFGTHLGAIRFDGKEFAYRQGRAWLPNDDIRQMAIDEQGTAWFATGAGAGSIARPPMTLAEKAEFYEQEIERYLLRTPYGYLSEAGLRQPPDKASADPHDSDNDGLWTSMYGAGECLSYAATKDPKAKNRAKKAFEALRFLQVVTQGGDHEPPKGFIARTIRPIEWPDPNAGRLAGDREEQKRDKFWKAHDPRWPKSADGKWYWKSDTSSDELDGHYFFYPLYFDFCADTDAERERVREVVRGITDHLLAHDFLLIDHDGKPTRWGIYGPQFINHDPLWWPERGLNSLSMLNYLSVAAHVTGDPKYAAASRKLIEQHAYALNLMNAKVQHGPGSGNQSDDEMAFMCYYTLLRCSQDAELKTIVRYSFFHYWVNESPEMNPFFNFAYAAQNLDALGRNPWGEVPLKPWAGWHTDSMATLYGFPLDRRNWSHKNSHRLDITFLGPVRSSDLDEPDPRHERGNRVNGNVVPVENRHFNHWNTDPWQLDYGGNGGQLASGTVFLLPYYMGLYHHFIELPAGPP